MDFRSFKNIAIVAGLALSLSVSAAVAESKSTKKSTKTTSSPTKPVKDGFASAGGLGKHTGDGQEEGRLGR